MKSNKTFFIMLGALVLCLLVIGYFAGVNYQSKRVLRSNDEAAKIVVAKKDLEISLLDKDNKALDGKIKEAEKRDSELKRKVSKLEQELVDNQQALEEVEQRLEAAEPEELLSTTHRVLETAEVWLTEAGAEFSLAAFRNNAIKLNDWENFTFVREPNYKELIIDKDLRLEESTRIRVNLYTKVENLGLTLIAERDKYKVMMTSFNAWKSYVKKRDRRDLLWDIVKVLGGYALGRLTK